MPELPEVDSYRTGLAKTMKGWKIKGGNAIWPRASDSNFNKHSKILENKLKEDNILISGLPIKATYNSPFTLPMLRRNEAMFKVEWNKK